VVGEEPVGRHFSYRDYAAALGNLRRAGLNPTLAAISKEIETGKGRTGVGGAGAQPEKTPESSVKGGGRPPALEGADEEIRQLRLMHQEAQNRIGELETQLEEARVDSVLTDSLEELIREQKLSLEATGQRVEALTVMLREASAKASRVDGLESSIVALEAEVEALRERERRLQASAAEHQARRHELESRLEEIWSERQASPDLSVGAGEAALLAELEDLRGKAAQLEGTLAETTGRLRQIEGDHAELEAALEALGREAGSLRSKNADL
jgi:chromosome segregation ATPase